jgi:ubiquinone/menaquinone biosynthesis C-methylase UbiE
MNRSNRHSTLQRVQSVSPYHAPRYGSLCDRLNSVKLSIAYRSYRSILSRYAHIPPHAVIADFGCGPGYLLSLVRKWYTQAILIGLDYELEILGEARARSSSHTSCPINLIQGDAEKLPFVPNALDSVICLHMVEHLHKPESFCNEVARVLKPGGWLFLATPNPKGLGAHIMGARWSGFRDDHIALKSPDEWHRLLLLCGFQPLVERTTGLSGLPIFRMLPLSIINWGALALFGSFPWRQGEAYISLWQKN